MHHIGRPIRVNIVLSNIDSDSILVARLETYARRAEQFSPFCSSEPLADHKTDCFVVDVYDLGWLLEATPRRTKPIIAYGQPDQLRSAFAVGCADYLKDPWTPEELHFRALKFRAPERHRFSWGTIELDGQIVSVTRQAAQDPVTIELNPQQAAVLETLLDQRGKPVPRDALFLSMWGKDGGDSRALDMQIHQLRARFDRLESGLGERLIRSVHGTGYLVP